MTDTYRVSVPLTTLTLNTLAELGRDFDTRAHLDLQASEIAQLRQQGVFHNTPNDALVYYRQHGAGLTQEFEFCDVGNAIDDIMAFYADEHPDNLFNNTLDHHQFPLNLAALTLKLTAMLSDTDGKIDPETNGTTVTALMTELGITPEQIFAVDEE